MLLPPGSLLGLSWSRSCWAAKARPTLIQRSPPSSKRSPSGELWASSWELWQHIWEGGFSAPCGVGVWCIIGQSVATEWLKYSTHTHTRQLLCLGVIVKKITSMDCYTQCLVLGAADSHVWLLARRGEAGWVEIEAILCVVCVSAEGCMDECSCWGQVSLSTLEHHTSPQIPVDRGGQGAPVTDGYWQNFAHRC